MAKEAEIKYLPLEKSKSLVWTYFGFPTRGGEFLEEKKKRKDIHCKMCKHVLLYKGNTILNLKHSKKLRNTFVLIPVVTISHFFGGKNMKKIFLFLSKIARKYLCIPATSVPKQRHKHPFFGISKSSLPSQATKKCINGNGEW